MDPTSVLVLLPGRTDYQADASRSGAYRRVARHAAAVVLASTRAHSARATTVHAQLSGADRHSLDLSGRCGPARDGRGCIGPGNGRMERAPTGGTARNSERRLDLP